VELAGHILRFFNTTFQAIKMNELSTFGIFESGVATIREQFMCIEIAGPDDTGGIASVKTAKAQVVRLRTGIEKQRKEIKQPFLETCKNIDAEAKRLTALITPIEDHLKAELAKLDDAKAVAEPEQPKSLKPVVRRLVENMNEVSEQLLQNGYRFMGESLQQTARTWADMVDMVQ
jgi:hypothetical protein